MPIKLRSAFFVGVAGLILWFLFLERALLSPFILAAIFAYIFNPVVDFFYQKIRLPRLISTIVIYLLILFFLVEIGFIITGQVISEFSDLQRVLSRLAVDTKDQIGVLPDFVRLPIQDALFSIDRSRLFSPQSVIHFFPQALSKIIGLFIFLFSGFFFLKEGKIMLNKALEFFPDQYASDIQILMRKINNVFGRYLRGQLFMVLLVSSVLFIGLSILGVRFALILSIFSGIAEIVPFIGPLTAGAVAMLIVLLTGTISFGLNPFQGALLVALFYFIVRQIQDYFVAPPIMGKIVGLHPLIILFAVLSGGRIGGLLGVVLAVPVAAAIRIILEFSLEKINKRS